jgi:hypothetical protein
VPLSPGTNKWNQIEHRLFCRITCNWQGIPLETYEIAINLIAPTRTSQSLEVHAWIDEIEYPKSKAPSKAQMTEVHLVRNKFHREWNYSILPYHEHCEYSTLLLSAALPQ